jgi:hypothetical protein
MHKQAASKSYRTNSPVSFKDSDGLASSTLLAVLALSNTSQYKTIGEGDYWQQLIACLPLQISLRNEDARLFVRTYPSASVAVP